MSKKKSYPIRVPRYAKGIRAQDARTGAVRSWWEKRWLATLERMNLGGRLGRGRNYALTGQVVALTLAGPHVEATVVGMRADPYRVTVDFRVPEGAARRRIVAALRGEPMLVARLLADDLPTEVEEIFRREGHDLFPGGKLKPSAHVGRRAEGAGLRQPLYDMTTRCTCPDYANPCKHSDAVLLLLGEEIARRPMTLVELRGIRPEELYES